jgi:hypothetical protein
MTEPNGSVSRRDLIKKGAFAGGLVWATPVLTSIAPAAAGTPPIRMDCPDCSTSLCPFIADRPCVSGSTVCQCAPVKGGGCACVNTTLPCARMTGCDTQPCEPGLICVVSCCEPITGQVHVCASPAGCARSPSEVAGNAN